MRNRSSRRARPSAKVTGSMGVHDDMSMVWPVMDSAVASTSVRWRAVGPSGGAMAARSPREMNVVSSRSGVVRSDLLGGRERYRHGQNSIDAGRLSLSGSMTTAVRLTEWTSCGGCAAKWGAAPLAQLVRDLAVSAPAAELLVGLAPFDDAAVYRLSDDLALVSTTDFFPPLVDDPADFGAIAAANACSDVFAMGGRVVLALNVSAFPERMPVEAVAAILARGGGGGRRGGRRGRRRPHHPLRGAHLRPGRAGPGAPRPRSGPRPGARPGDVLVLSKPIGTGIVLAGGADDDKAAAIARMRALNRAAAEALAALPAPPSAVTDVTGFGLLGHAWEMAERSGVRLVPRRRDAAAVRRRAGRGRGGRAHRRRRPQPDPPRGPGRGRGVRRAAGGAGLRPADLRRPAGRRPPGTPPCWPAPASSSSARSRRRRGRRAGLSSRLRRRRRS